MKGGVSRFAGRWGLCPQTPGIFRVAAKMAEGKTSGRPQLPPSRATSATESALGLRPRRALSSAQFGAQWNNSTSPYNDFPLNGTYPLNSVSHSRGSLQRDVKDGAPCESGNARGVPLIAKNAMSGAPAFIFRTFHSSTRRVPQTSGCRTYSRSLRMSGLPTSAKLWTGRLLISNAHS